MLDPFRYLSLGFDLARLTSEAQAVVALRLTRLLSGDATAGTEATRMVVEKAMALGEANMRIASAAVRGQLDDAAHDVVALYRRRVRANRRRLSR